MKRLAGLLMAGWMLMAAGCAPEEAPVPAETGGIVSESPAAADTPVSTDAPVQKSALAQIVDDMTLEEKVGQMFIARCPESDAAALAGEYQLGGYILFARDFENSSPEQLKNTLESYQEQTELPLFIGVDEEGGTVVRASRYQQFRDERFASPQALYKRGGFDAVEADAREKSEFLLDLGINLNFAPVCDVSQNPEDFIYARAFGKDAAATAEYVRVVVEAMDAAGIGSVLKHFPGYGDNVDTHTGVAHDQRSYETFWRSDFLPFEAGIEAGAGMVLVSHNIVACMDPDYPASLSAKVHGILREELGFDGVAITDDLAMDAIGEFAGDNEAAVLAVQAGNDMLCCTDFQTQIPAVIQAVQDGTVAEERIDAAVLRILKLKERLGLLE